MNNFLSEIKEIVNAINNSPKDKRYFLSGGCSNLANYFTPTFIEKEGKIEFALFIFAEEEWDVEQINKIMNRSNKEKLNNLITEEIILIDHIAILHEGMIYDGNGVHEKNVYTEKFMLANTFMRTIKFGKNDFVEDFLSSVRQTHIFGNDNPTHTRRKISKLMNQVRKPKSEYIECNNFSYK